MDELTRQQREAVAEALSMYLETLRGLQRESSYSGINARRIAAAEEVLTLLQQQENK